ncbi:MAG: cation:proton antiporter [Aquificae bacterium]|nr:cation:proton antiporter [Aquificota bacterium]
MHELFLALFLIFVSARFFGELFVRFGLPAVIGELFAGIVLGPSLLNIIQPNEVLRLLAEIGILLLLFQVGLETDLKKIKDTGIKSIIVAVVGAAVPFIGGFLVSYYIFHQPVIVSLFIGGTLTATSIGITLRVFEDLGKQRTSIAQIVVGAAVIDDIIGVVLLVFINEFMIVGEVKIEDIIRVIFLIFFFLGVAPVAAYILSHFVRRLERTSHLPGFVPTIIVSLIFLFAYVSHIFGAPEILGSFAAGLAMSRRFVLPFAIAFQADERFLQKVEREMKPIIYLFTPIFFVMVGLSMNIREIHITDFELFIFALILLIIAIVGKFVGALLLRKLSLVKKAIIGVSMIPRGEVGLIFAELGKTNGVLKMTIYDALLFIIIVTTVIAPFLIKWLFKYEETLEEEKHHK